MWFNWHENETNQWTILCGIFVQTLALLCFRQNRTFKDFYRSILVLSIAFGCLLSFSHSAFVPALLCKRKKKKASKKKSFPDFSQNCAIWNYACLENQRHWIRRLHQRTAHLSSEELFFLSSSRQEWVQVCKAELNRAPPSLVRCGHIPLLSSVRKTDLFLGELASSRIPAGTLSSYNF